MNKIDQRLSKYFHILTLQNTGKRHLWEVLSETVKLCDDFNKIVNT